MPILKVYQNKTFVLTGTDGTTGAFVGAMILACAVSFPGIIVYHILYFLHTYSWAICILIFSITLGIIILLATVILKGFSYRIFCGTSEAWLMHIFIGIPFFWRRLPRHDFMEVVQNDRSYNEQKLNFIDIVTYDYEIGEQASIEFGYRGKVVFSLTDKEVKIYEIMSLLRSAVKQVTE